MNDKCIFPPGEAFVVNLPNGFNLIAEIKSAKTIRLATAFARESGWELIADGIQQSEAKIELLTGLDFNTTEPRVLEKWHELLLKGKTSAKLFCQKGINFHPKVFIVEKGGNDFAIVGSGNLSEGGFRDNIECSIYTEEPEVIRGLISWYDLIFNDPTKTIDIAPENIKEYKKIYKKNYQNSKNYRKSEHEAISIIEKGYLAHMDQRHSAINKARNFIQTHKFKEWFENHKISAERIKKYLDYPNFDFSKTGLDDFFKIQSLGHLIAIRKPSIWKNKDRVKKIFRFLINENISIATRINAIQGKNANEYYSDGLGMNILTKILAVHMPREYPVINAPVKKALDIYKYHLPVGATVGTKYEQLSIFMKSFNKESGLPDMLALDVFLYSIGEKRSGN